MSKSLGNWRGEKKKKEFGELLTYNFFKTSKMRKKK